MDRFLPIGQKHAYLAAALLIVVVAAALRIFNIDERSLWYDELATANYSRGTLTETLAKTRSDSSAPILHPVVLNVVERFGDDAWTVRMPSAVASVLAIVVLLCANWAGLSKHTALLSALLLALSVSQIRYGQEVREYSLSVLMAALLMLGYLRYASSKESWRSVALLGPLLLVAPFIQYGLVLFGGMILTSMLIVRIAQGAKWQNAFGEVGTTAAWLGAGALGSFLLTLQDQLYLLDMQQNRGFYYNPAIHHNILIFVASQVFNFLAFMLEGRLLVVLIVPSLGYFAWLNFKNRRWDPLLVVTLVSLATAVILAVLRLYPFGGFRQSLYLSPMLALATAAGIDKLIGRVAVSRQQLAAGVAVVLIATIGLHHVARSSPYREVEDIKSVLAALTKSAKADDQIYVYYQAQFGVEFYKFGHAHVLYGDDHRDDPAQFVSRLQEWIDPKTVRLWLVFSHITNHEDALIVNALRPRWAIEKVVDVNGAALYLARRT